VAVHAEVEVLCQQLVHMMLWRRAGASGSAFFAPKRCDHLVEAPDTSESTMTSCAALDGLFALASQYREWFNLSRNL
jgi:hypothetical protein